MENTKILKATLLVSSIIVLFATSAYADFWTLTPVDPTPNPPDSLLLTGQFGNIIAGPVSVDFEATGGAFSGTLIASAFRNGTNTTFVYRIEMDADPPGASIDKFRLATMLPPDLAINEITSVGYNNYYASLDANTAPALCWSGLDGMLTVIDFDYLNPPDDETGLLAGDISEVFIETTNDVDVGDVFAIFIDAGTSVDITIGGVVVPSPPPIIPEPATIGMIVAGMLGVAGFFWKRLR